MIKFQKILLILSVLILITLGIYLLFLVIFPSAIQLKQSYLGTVIRYTSPRLTIRSMEKEITFQVTDTTKAYSSQYREDGMPDTTTSEDIPVSQLSSYLESGQPVFIRSISSKGVFTVLEIHVLRSPKTQITPDEEKIREIFPQRNLPKKLER